MWEMPNAARTANQTIISGPKSAPTRAVPYFCTANSNTNAITVKDTIHGDRTGVTTPTPSNALSIVIAGVIIPSP
jgi:hypothetical protein